MQQTANIENQQDKTLRQKVAKLFEPESTKLASKIIRGLIILVIGIAILSVILESVPSYHAEYEGVFLSLAITTTAFFAIEYILRLWTVPDLKAYQHLPALKARIKYIKSPEAIIDLVAFLPVILTFNHVDLRMLRMLRLFSILKLTRYNQSLNILLTVVRNERHTILATFFILLIMLVVTSTGIYLIERDSQPEAFGSIPKAMWWAIITITTIGYGDVIPVTTLGQVFASVIVFIGIGIIALPTGILASGFSAQLNRRKTSYLEKVKKALADGDINFSELKELKEIQSELSLSDEEADAILREQLAYAKEVRKVEADPNLGQSEIKHKNLLGTPKERHYCPHCGEDLYS